VVAPALLIDDVSCLVLHSHRCKVMMMKTVYDDFPPLLVFEVSRGVKLKGVSLCLKAICCFLVLVIPVSKSFGMIFSGCLAVHESVLL